MSWWGDKSVFEKRICPSKDEPKLCVKCGERPAKPHWDNGLYCGDDRCDECFEEMVIRCRQRSW